MSENATPNILELRDLHKQFGDTRIICGADLQLRQGERLALIGPNGAGKSTLFNLISGRTEVSSGEVLLHGRQINSLSPFQINRLGLARSFQITNIFPQLSVQENLRAAVLSSHGYRQVFWRRLSTLRAVNRRTEEVLQQCDLEAHRDTPGRDLGYAAQRALEIGITIAGDAALILLDEPTAGMSRDESAAAAELIRRVSAGKTLLMIEHDMEVVFGLVDRIAVLVEGRIIACDTPAAIRGNLAVQAAYLGQIDAEPMR
ncbi:amino acid/amide ABC transporter ATP-binding protein 1, HAAT family (TC 3.A.1.4.-) [Collimonas sp. OK307]|uniref:ABC transporter ATP-binding protein n=1 Tax=Collimonas sp. OK307 TaxID=1801620 RepID=UPI0008E927C2|nr:ABC transporter ATP-binding protein [Collimonas sp. OK307]SFH64574.1 amino acid/amide ABC transporter ATP-binding protein 1, HAAT family (TC 3.A.1.4.-) [Collimonas sp. OK307]